MLERVFPVGESEKGLLKVDLIAIHVLDRLLNGMLNRMEITSSGIEFIVEKSYSIADCMIRVGNERRKPKNPE